MNWMLVITMRVYFGVNVILQPMPSDAACARVAVEVQRQAAALRKQEIVEVNCVDLRLKL